MYKFVDSASVMVKLLRIIHYDACVRTFLHGRTRRHLAEVPAKIAVNRPAILCLTVMPVKRY